MSKNEAEVTNVREVRGKDGAVAYEVTGGKAGAGEATYYIGKEAFHAAEKDGRASLKDLLQRGIETTLENGRERRRDE